MLLSSIPSVYLRVKRTSQGRSGRFVLEGPDIGHWPELPVINGLSGWEPRGWNLFDVFSPEPEAHVRSWLGVKGIANADVCIVPVRVTLSDVPDSRAQLMP